MLRKTEAAMAAFLAFTVPAFGASTIEVPLGGATQVPLGPGVRQVVVGNPAIADVSVRRSGGLTVFGKYPGGTTVSALDGGGHPLFDAVVVVTSGSPQGVAVHYGNGKNWVPGGATVVAECSTGHCSQAMPLPADTAFKPDTGK